MPYFWTLDRLDHLAEHGVTQEEFERVVGHPDSVESSRASPDREIAFGYTEDGRYIACVHERLDDGVTVIPVTAFEAPEPRG